MTMRKCGNTALSKNSFILFVVFPKDGVDLKDMEESSVYIVPCMLPQT